MTDRARFVSYVSGGAIKYGFVKEEGIVDLSARCGADFPTLRDAVVADALQRLANEAVHYSADYALDSVKFLSPVPAPEKIICISVNYPDRNEEYKDDQAAPKFPSLFLRTPRSFVGRETPLVRPRASPQLDYEAELVLVIGKAGRHIPEQSALDHVAAMP